MQRSAYGQSRIDCNALNQPVLKQTVHYCVYLPAGLMPLRVRVPRSAIPSVFLHGLGDNEQTLFSSGGGPCWTTCAPDKMGDFLIVRPRTRSFYVNSANGSFATATSFAEFIPHIESRYRIRTA